MGISKFLIILLFIPFGVVGQDYCRPIGYFQNLEIEKEKRIATITINSSLATINAMNIYMRLKNYDKRLICLSFGFSLVASYCLIKIRDGI